MTTFALPPPCSHLRIGRDPVPGDMPGAAVLALPGERLSRNHLDLWQAEGLWYAADLGSSNGTFLLGQAQRMGERNPIPLPPDRVSRFFLGGYLLVFDPIARQAQAHELGQAALLEVRSVSVEKPSESGPRRIIQDVSFTAFPGRVTAVMGGSGTGKSTLLKAICGLEAPTSGEVRLNENNLFETPELRLIIGYLPQEDVFHEDLSIREVLDYTLQLRLPELGPAERQARIAEVLRAVALEEAAADGRRARVLSGGQRKRLGIAMELLADPKLLFLDEPTSGLSSEDAFDLLATLRQIAEARGTCILLVIHQPSLDAYRQLHDLVVLKRDPGSPAELVFAGPAWPDALTYFQGGVATGALEAKYGGHPDPGVVLLATEGSQAKGSLGWNLAAWRARWTQSGYGALHAQIPTSMTPRELPTLRPFGFQQFGVLLSRNLRLKLRDRRTLALVFLQPLFIAIALATALGHFNALRDSLHFNHLFFLMFSALWCGASNPPTEIVGERRILTRERSVNLKLPSFACAKLATFALFSAVQVLLLLLVLIPAWGLEASPGSLFALLLLVSLCGNALGLLLSALAGTAEFAVSLVPVPLVVMLLFAGGPIQRLPSMNTFAAALSNLMPSRWGFEGMVQLEADSRGPLAVLWHSDFFSGERGASLGACYWILLVWYALVSLGLLGVLRRQLGR